MKNKVKKLLLLMWILLICCILSSCEKEKKKVTITVIHSWGGTETDHVAMRQIYEQFQNENPDINLRLISMPTRNETLRKVEDMIMVGDTPDIIAFSGMGENSIYNFMVENNMALDIQPYLEEDLEFDRDVSETNKKYWTTGAGDLYTVVDVLSLSGGYWYNEEILEKAEREGTATYVRRWRPEEGKTLPPIPAGIEPVVRFKMPTDGVTRWNDLVKGESAFPTPRWTTSSSPAPTARLPTTSAWWWTTWTWASPT